MLHGPERLHGFRTAVLAAMLFGAVGAAAPSPRPAPEAAPPSAPQPSPSPEPSPTPSPAPSPEPSPSPEPALSPEPAAVPGAAPSTSPAPPGNELPRIIRTVCTDRVCGGCDGRCRTTSGHVAVDKKGRCACTPAEGGPLDRAIRQAYQRNPPQ